jgi:hypothetical protein
MSDSNVSRRDFLRRASLVGVATVGGSTLLSACGGDDAAETATDAAAPEYPVVDSSTCAGYDELSETDLAARNGLGYVSNSPVEGQYCGNCQLKAEYPADSRCLGCQIFQGPVSPGGWCQSWVPLAT